MNACTHAREMVGLSTQDQKEEKGVCVSGLVEKSQPCSPKSTMWETREQEGAATGLWALAPPALVSM